MGATKSITLAIRKVAGARLACERKSGISTAIGYARFTLAAIESVVELSERRTFAFWASKVYSRFIRVWSQTTCFLLFILD